MRTWGISLLGSLNSLFEKNADEKAPLRFMEYPHWILYIYIWDSTAYKYGLENTTKIY